MLAGAALVDSAIIDQAGGFWREQYLTKTPEVEVHRNPKVARTILVAGGLANNGIDMGRAMRGALSPLGSILAVRYAETNLRSDLLHGAITDALDAHGLADQPIDTYCNSAAGIFLAQTVRWLAADGRRFGTMVLDCCPANVHDIEGIQGLAVRGRLDILRYSRAFNVFMQFASNHVLPPPSDRDPDVPESLAAAHRRAIVRTDSITSGMEAAYMRAHPVLPGSLAGIAERTVFMHAPQDPLVNFRTAVPAWRRACGSLEEVVDPARPAFSHAAGPTHPRGVAAVLAVASA